MVITADLSDAVCAAWVMSAEDDRCRCVVGTVMKTSPSRSEASSCFESFLLPHSEFVSPPVLSVLCMWTTPPSCRYCSPCLVHRFSAGVGGGLNADPLRASAMLGALATRSCLPRASSGACRRLCC